MRVAQFVLASIPVLIQLYAEKYLKDDFDKTMDELEDELNIPKIKVYDFIVVGGGTAGCVVAGRLSEKFNVLLLEAGGTPPPAVSVPAFAEAVTCDSNINYFFKSLPMTNASRITNGIVINPAGKMLGGSGSHNDMTHNRGNPRDYDNWAEITKDESFAYKNVLKYFVKYENFVGKRYNDIGDEFYGKGGPINVETSEVPFLPLWFQAGKELGYSITDPNGFQREGFAPINTATRHGKRSSSYAEYIKPFENQRKNLAVIRYATVLEVLLDANNKAYGVAYNRHAFPQIAHATKEIILSAGAFSSPLLLMKSGIGPLETLKAAEIPVKVPLEAVGKTLIEHPFLFFGPFYVNDSSLFLKMNPNETEKIVEDYHKGKGPLILNSERPTCFIASSKAERGWPNLWMDMVANITTDGEKQIITFWNRLGRPKSRGTLKMDTEKYQAGVRDDVELALVDFKLLTHPDDLDAMVEGIKFVLRIAEDTKAFQSLNMTYGGKPLVECSAFTFRSDDYWKCFIQQKTTTGMHMVATNSLGPDDGDSDSSVVDTKFRVRGVSNLRVVDASVMPEITNANINAAVLMLGEKGADEIIKKWTREI